jgi:hypothetical protein
MTYTTACKRNVNEALLQFHFLLQFFSPSFVPLSSLLRMFSIVQAHTLVLTSVDFILKYLVRGIHQQRAPSSFEMNMRIYKRNIYIFHIHDNVEMSRCCSQPVRDTTAKHKHTSRAMPNIMQCFHAVHSTNTSFRAAMIHEHAH